jgi:hypothetical protein
MSGYNYSAGMSNCAVAAYNAGLSPLSRISLDELRFAGWRETKALAKALAKSGHWHRAEWHHTGGTWYNATDFYHPRDLVTFWDELTLEERQQIKSELTTKKPPREAIKVRGEYTIWGGSRRRPRKMGEQAFTGTKTGDWIELDHGGRKKASGRWIVWEVAT